MRIGFRRGAVAARRIMGGLLLAILVALALGSAPASAGTIVANVSIQGAGMVFGNSTPFSCDRNANLDDRVTVFCGAAHQSFPMFQQHMYLQAIVPAGPPGHWRVRWQGCSGTDVPGGAVCIIIDNGPNSVRTANVKAIFDDVLPPTVTAATPVFSTTVNSGVSFNVAANEPLASASCSVGGRPALPCNQAQSVPEGTHTVKVVGRDRSGNTSLLSASVGSVRIIDTRLTHGPASFSNLKRPTFRYATGVGAGASFECWLDSVPHACGATFTPLTDLPEGPHTFRVRASDGPETDRTPLVRTWTVDTVAPNTSLNAANIPEGVVTTLLGATFTFGSSEPLGQLQCKLDAAVFVPCASPRALTNLPFGTRNFQVRAVDRAGNVDGSPASRTWTIAAKDDDGDGFNQRTDCNDASITINPARPEILDNDVDENCDGAKGINLDRDGDGAQRPGDCNDTDANVRPGAVDLPGNGLDEDCRGGDAILVLDPDLVHSSRTFSRFTTLTKLQVKLPANTGATVKVTCKIGKNKCAGKAKRAVTKRNAGKLTNLKQQFVGVRFKPNTVITVTVSKANAIGSVKTLKIRKGKVPLVTTKCTPIGGTKAVAC